MMTRMNRTRKVLFRCDSRYEIRGSPCMNISLDKGGTRTPSSLNAASCADVNCWDCWKIFRTPNTRTAFLMNEFWHGPLELMIAGKPCCKCDRPKRHWTKLGLNKISFEIEIKVSYVRTKIFMTVEMVDQMRALAEHLWANQTFMIFILGVSSMVSSQFIELLENFIAQFTRKLHLFHFRFMCSEVRSWNCGEII